MSKNAFENDSIISSQQADILYETNFVSDVDIIVSISLEIESDDLVSQNDLLYTVEVFPDDNVFFKINKFHYSHTIKKHFNYIKTKPNAKSNIDITIKVPNGTKCLFTIRNHFNRTGTVEILNIRYLEYYLYNLPEFVNTNMKQQAFYQVRVNDVPFTFYTNFSEMKKKKIIFFFPGASTKKHKYDVQRYSWGAQLMNYETCFFADPTVSETVLRIGWFQYSQENFGIDSLVTLINCIVQIKGYQESDIVFFGSSAGGFVALKLAEYFARATVIAINPQIYLFNYHKTFYQKMLDVCYPNTNPNKIQELFLNRISVHRIVADRVGKTFIFQNKYDQLHYQKHIGDYLNNNKLWNNVSSINQFDVNNIKNNFNVIFYEDEKLGHTPPNRDVCINYIHSILSSDKNNVIHQFSYSW